MSRGYSLVGQLTHTTRSVDKEVNHFKLLAWMDADCGSKEGNKYGEGRVNSHSDAIQVGDVNGELPWIGRGH